MIGYEFGIDLLDSRGRGALNEPAVRNRLERLIPIESMHTRHARSDEVICPSLGLTRCPVRALLAFRKRLRWQSPGGTVRAVAVPSDWPSSALTLIEDSHLAAVMFCRRIGRASMTKAGGRWSHWPPISR